MFFAPERPLSVVAACALLGSKLEAREANIERSDHWTRNADSEPIACVSSTLMGVLPALIRERDATIVATLAASPRPLGLRELARTTGYPRRTITAVVARLLAHGVIVDERRQGLRLFRVHDSVDRAAIPMEFAKHLLTPREIRVVDVALLREFGLQRTVRPFTIASVKAKELVPPDAPRPIVTFRFERPLQFKRLRGEDVVIALLRLNPKEALRLARDDNRVGWLRLRTRIRQEDVLDEAKRAGVAQLAWAGALWRIRESR